MKIFRTGIWMILGAVVVLGLSVVSSYAAVIFEDDFNSANGGNYALNWPGSTNWTVLDGTVDLIGSGSPYDYYPGHGLYLDLDGSTHNAGRLVSSNISLPSGSYTLSFLLGGSTVGGSNTDTVQVSVAIGWLAETSITMASNAPLTQYNYDFDVASGTSANIIFNHLGGDNIGLILDDVILTSVSNGSAVPEPSTLLLLGSGLVGLVGYGRRRFRK